MVFLFKKMYRLEHDTTLAVDWFKNNFRISVIYLFLDINMKLFRLKQVKRRPGKATNKNCLVLLLIEI